MITRRPILQALACACIALFALRVLAQLIQYAWPVPWLPAFEAWQGSGLPYSVLLASQSLILVLMSRGALAMHRNTRARPRLGAWLLGVGGIYFVAMSLRLLLGLTVLANVPWFAKWLPAFFHVVLATYVLTLGEYHRRSATREQPA